MERHLKERLVGAAILVAIAVIFIPMLLDESPRREDRITGSNIPARPDREFSSSIIPLEPPAVEPAPATKQPAEPATEPAPEHPAEPAVPPPEPTPPGSEPVQTAAADPGKSAGAVGLSAWVVQLGSFASEDNAKSLSDKLRKAGYPAFVEPLTQDNKTVYRVRVGPELLKAEAEKLRTQIAQKLALEGIVVRYP
jgi:DedD protein